MPDTPDAPRPVKRRGPGRPRIVTKPAPPLKREIDLGTLEKLAALQCTLDEAAAFLEVSRRTLLSRMRSPEFRDVWQRGSLKGLVSLRRHQFALAERNPALAIWLGKQYLAQREPEVRHELSGPGGGPLEVRSWADLLAAAGVSLAAEDHATRTNGHGGNGAGNGHDAQPEPGASAAGSGTA